MIFAPPSGCGETHQKLSKDIVDIDCCLQRVRRFVTCALRVSRSPGGSEFLFFNKKRYCYFTGPFSFDKTGHNSHSRQNKAEFNKPVAKAGVKSSDSI
jgi:hypothetical protein